MDIFLLVIGFLFLFFAGQYLVKGSVSLSHHLKVPTLVIGVTVVAFGTSAPELMVSVGAAIKGFPDIAMGNVIGSNISNIGLVLGISVIILPIPVKRNTLVFDWPVMMGAGILLFVFVQDGWLRFQEGLIFLLFLAAFVYISMRQGRATHAKEGKGDIKPEYNLWLSCLIIVISCIGLVYGSDWLINGATGIARQMGVTERVVSLSLVAVGTSIPEMATSLVAAVKGEPDISVGNIVGSNIFNILAVLGVTSLIQPLKVDSTMAGFDMFWMLGISLALLVFIIPFRALRLTRGEGGFLFLLYAVYMYLLFSN